MVLGIILLLIISLFGVMMIKSSKFSSKQFTAERSELLRSIELDTNSIADRLSGSIKFQTISYPDTTKFNDTAFSGLLDYMKTIFPKVYSHLELEMIGRYSLLFTWKGQSESLDPIVLMSHFDVVGIEEGTEQKWKYPPFEGQIREGYIWGRGTLDDKVGVIGILEAAEQLISNGFIPNRTIYFAFGHDEEVGGMNGASLIAQTLKSRGIKPECVLDEGGIVVSGMMPGVEAPTALVGLAEKGYVSVELTAKSDGGHSSAPPKHTSLGRLSKAITLLEENPMPADIKDASEQMIRFLGPEMKGPMKLFFANSWLTKGMIKNQFSKSPFTNAMIRTSTAATKMSGSETENVLPKISQATVNFRLLPGDSIKDVLAHVRNTIKDSTIDVRAFSMGIEGGNEPSPVASVQSESFHQLQKSIHQIFPDAIVTPWQLIGTTDSKYYNTMAKDIYRFVPVLTTDEDMSGYHGTNERIAVSSYVKCVEFLMQFMINMDE